MQTAGNALPLPDTAFPGLSWLFRSFKLRLSVLSYKSLFRPLCPPPSPSNLSTESPLCQKDHDYGNHAVNSTCNSRPLCVYLVRLLLRLHLLPFISSPAMRSPEMSYSPAYYHDQGPNPRSSIVTPPPATRHSQEQSSVLGHPVGESRTSSPIPSRDASPRTSGSRQHRVYHTQTLGGTAWPGSDARDGGSTLSGAHKEERATSSWADQPSVMSGELSNPSITRVRKRPISNVEIITNEGQDALLMLVRAQYSGLILLC